MRVIKSLSSKSLAQVQLFARQHPSRLTESEARLWSALEARQPGVSFRRQAVVGGFIADFCAPSIRLIVEVDGLIHARTEALTRVGTASSPLSAFAVRVPAALVLSDLTTAVALVRAAL